MLARGFRLPAGQEVLSEGFPKLVKGIPEREGFFRGMTGRKSSAEAVGYIRQRARSQTQVCCHT